MSLNGPMQDVLDEVMAERFRQDEKWGEQNHDTTVWSVILTEECGEFAQAALWDRFGSGMSNKDFDARKEAIQCAAVAIAIVQCIDRMAAKKKESST